MGYLTWSIDVSSAQAFGEINIYPLVDGAVNYLAFQCRNNRIIQSLQGNCIASHKLWQTLVNFGWKFMTQMHVPSFSRGSHETVLPRLTGQLVLRVFIVQDNSHFFIYPAHLTLPSSRKCKTTCVWIPSNLFFTNGIFSVSWVSPCPQPSAPLGSSPPWGNWVWLDLEWPRSVQTQLMSNSSTSRVESCSPVHFPPKHFFSIEKASHGCLEKGLS